MLGQTAHQSLIDNISNINNTNDMNQKYGAAISLASL